MVRCLDLRPQIQDLENTFWDGFELEYYGFGGLQIPEFMFRVLDHSLYDKIWTPNH